MVQKTANAATSDGRRPRPYGENPFRVLGLGTSAADADIRRRARERQRELELDGADDEVVGQIRDAMATLQQPAARQRAELWWLHLTPDPVPPDLDPSDARGVGLAINRLSYLVNSADPGKAADARHDLAVLLHASALEDARAGEERHREALTAWKVVFEDAGYWRQVTERALQSSDPRVTADTVATERANLPNAVLEATAQHISDGLSRQDDRTVRALLRVLSESGFPDQALTAARSTALSPIMSALRAATRDIRTRLQSQQPGANRNAEARLAALWQDASTQLVEPLSRLREFAPTDAQAAVLADEIASLIDLIATHLVNGTDRLDLALTVSEAALACAASGSSHDYLRGELRKVREAACSAALQRCSDALTAGNVDAAAHALEEAERLADGEEARAAVASARRAIASRRPTRQPSGAPPPPRPPGQAPNPGAGPADAGRRRPTASTPPRDSTNRPPDPTLRMDNPFAPRRSARILSPRVLAGTVAASLLCICLGFLLVAQSTSRARQTPPVTPPQVAQAAPPAAPPAAPALIPAPTIVPPAVPPPVIAQPLPTVDTRTLPPPPTAAPPPTTPPTPEPVLARVEVHGAGVERVRLREGPSTSSRVIDGLNDGEQLDQTAEPVMAESIPWVRVRTKNGTRGYVALEFLRLPGAATAAPPTPAPPLPTPAPPVAPTAAAPSATLPVRIAAPAPPTAAPVFSTPVAPAPASAQAQRPAPTAPPNTSRPAATATSRPPATATRSAPTSTPTPRPASDDPQTLKGNGASRTRRFQLQGGDYVISWRVQATGGNPAYDYCRIDGELTSPNGGETWDFESENARPTRDPVKGETRAHGVPGGSYFFEIDDFNLGSNCSWEVTIAPDRRR